MQGTKKKAMKSSIRKNIDLPTPTVQALDKMAINGRMKTKPYIEKVLIEFAANAKNKTR